MISEYHPLYFWLEGLDDIPLCYYNTFFIYYNQYSLEVQPFTNFPKPVDCPKLFRFGFNLEPDIWEYFQLTQKTAVLANDRISCGFPGISKVFDPFMSVSFQKSSFTASRSEVAASKTRI